MIYHFEEEKINEIFEVDGYPQIYHISRLKLQNNAFYQAMHSHEDRVEILYLLSGSGWHTVGKYRYPTSAGDLVIINSGVLHEEKVRGKEPLEFYGCAVTNLKLKGKKRGQLIDEDRVPVLSLGSQKQIVEDLFGVIQKESMTENVWKNEICTFLASALVLKVAELTQKSEWMDSKAQKEHWMIEKVQNYMEQNFRDKISLEDMSKIVSVSPWYLERVFKKYTGDSLNQYLIRLKLGYAQNLFRDTSKSIAQVAEEVGYDNPSYFSQLFKKKFGVTPGAYRKKLKESSDH